MERGVDPHSASHSDIYNLLLACVSERISTADEVVNIWQLFVFPCWKLFSGKFLFSAFYINLSSDGVCSLLTL